MAVELLLLILVYKEGAEFSQPRSTYYIICTSLVQLYPLMYVHYISALESCSCVDIP